MTPEENAIRHALNSYDSAPNWRKGFTLNRLHAYCTPAAMTALLAELDSLRKDAESATPPLTDEQAKMLWKRANDLWVSSRDNAYITLPLIYAREIQKALGICMEGTPI